MWIPRNMLVVTARRTTGEKVTYSDLKKEGTIIVLNDKPCEVFLYDAPRNRVFLEMEV